MQTPITMEIPQPAEPAQPVVPDTPAVPADPTPSRETPDAPTGPDAPAAGRPAAAPARRAVGAGSRRVAPLPGLSFADPWAVGLAFLGLAVFAAVGALSHEHERAFSASLIYLGLGVVAAVGLPAFGIALAGPGRRRAAARARHRAGGGDRALLDRPEGRAAAALARVEHGHAAARDRRCRRSSRWPRCSARR